MMIYLCCKNAALFKNKIHVFLFRLLAAVMEGHSIDGFDGKLQLVSADDIKQAYALESQSMHSCLTVFMCVYAVY